MSTPFEIDLETERLLLDGAWLSSDELASRITQAIAQKNFAGVGRLGEAVELLSQAVGSSKTISFKVSGDFYQKLEAMGGKLGKTASATARDWLMQSLSGPAGAQPVAVAPAPAPAPVAAAKTSSDVAPEEAAQALTLTPKRRDTNPPPVMAPVAAPANAPNVVVDLSSDDQKKNAGDSRRWFNRS